MQERYLEVGVSHIILVAYGTYLRFRGALFLYFHWDWLSLMQIVSLNYFGWLLGLVVLWNSHSLFEFFFK